MMSGNFDNHADDALNNILDYEFLDGASYHGKLLEFLYKISELRHSFIEYQTMINNIETLVHKIEDTYNVDLDYNNTPLDLPDHHIWFITRLLYPN